eukprot:2387_1
MVDDILSSFTTEFVEIGRFEPAIYGSGRKTIDRICRESDTLIEIRGGSGKKRAEISGFPENVKTAKQIIQRTMDGCDTVVEILDIGSFGRAIMGAGGDRIRRVSETFGVGVSFVGVKGKRESIQVVGPTKGVQQAIENFRGVMDKSVTEFVEIGRFVSSIYGPGRKTISQRFTGLAARPSTEFVESPIRSSRLGAEAVKSELKFQDFRKMWKRRNKLS